MEMTDEQFAALAPWEDNYKSAIEAKYTRYPGAEAINTMFNIYRALTNTRVNINRSCSVCLLHLVQKVGRLYFAEKERRAQLAIAEALKVSVSSEPEPKPDKAKKTTRKRTKKDADNGTE